MKINKIFSLMTLISESISRRVLFLLLFSLWIVTWQGNSAGPLLLRGFPKASFRCCSLSVSIKETYRIRNLFTFTSKVIANGKLAATLLCSLNYWCISVSYCIYLAMCDSVVIYNSNNIAPGCHLLLWQLHQTLADYQASCRQIAPRILIYHGN